MSDWMDGAGEAVPLVVPLIADNVLGPRVIYGPMPVCPGDPSLPLDAIVLPLEEGLPGRVTFECLDAIRAARGELLPYQRRDVPFTRDEWVYVIEGSAWLEETRRDRIVSSFVTGFFDSDRSQHVAIADAETFAARWLTRIETVAHRRDEPGQQQLPPDAQDTPPDTT